MERMATAAGARFEIRDGWKVAVEYGPPASSDKPIPQLVLPTSGSRPVAWADVSYLRKLEIRASVAGELGRATRAGDGWLCPLTPDRALAIGEADAPADATDVTCCYAALTILGPMAREVIARFCALDLRPSVAPPGSFRPGSIARQPGMIVCEAEQRFLLLFGWAVGEYLWTVVQDAARPFGGAPIGLDALPAVAGPGVSARA